MMALRIIGGVLALFGLIPIALGILSKLAHWPGAMLCFFGGGVLLVTGILLFTIGFLKRNENKRT